MASSRLRRRGHWAAAVRRSSKYAGVGQRCRPDCPDQCRRHSWEWHADLGRDPITGKRIQETGTAPTAREASEDRAECIRVHRTGGQPVGLRRTTVGQYLDQWLQRSVEHGGKRPTTQRGDRQAIDLYIKPLIGDVLMPKLTAQHIETRLLGGMVDLSKERAQVDADERRRRWEAREAKRKRPRPEGFVPPTFEPRAAELKAMKIRVYAVLRAALNSAVKRGELNRNPCDHVEFSTPRKRKRVKIAWTLAHVRQYCAAVVDEQLGPLFLLAALLGLRRGELCGLRWVDVHLDEGYLTVDTQLYTVGYKVGEGAPKSDSGDEEPIQLDTATVEMLRRVRTKQREQRLAWGQGWVDSGRVFTREDGSAWHPDRVYKIHAALLRKLGLPHVRLHDLRHISVMLGAEAGETIEQASRRLRHSSISVTSDFYGHQWEARGKLTAEARRKVAFGTGTDS